MTTKIADYIYRPIAFVAAAFVAAVLKQQMSDGRDDCSSDYPGRCNSCRSTDGIRNLVGLGSRAIAASRRAGTSVGDELGRFQAVS